MSDLSRKIAQIEMEIGNMNARKAERLRERYRSEFYRVFVVNLARNHGLIPADYSDEKYELAKRIKNSLPKESNEPVDMSIPIEELKAHLKTIVKEVLSGNLLNEYIPDFDKIKLRKPEEAIAELGTLDVLHDFL